MYSFVFIFFFPGFTHITSPENGFITSFLASTSNRYSNLVCINNISAFPLQFVSAFSGNVFVYLSFTFDYRTYNIVQKTNMMHHLDLISKYNIETCNFTSSYLALNELKRSTRMNF